VAKSKDDKSKDKKPVSRRDFLVTSGAITAAGALGAVIPKAMAATPSKPGIPQKWDYEADVVIVGYGGAGIVAAITAAENGASVLCLEKAPYRGGGSTSISLGEWVSPTNKQDAIDYLTTACKGDTPDDVIEAWAEEVCKNKAFYDRMGVEVSVDGMSNEKGERSNPGYASLPGAKSMRYFRTKGMGEGWFAAMEKHIKDLGVKVVFGARGRELIQDPTAKEILGVRADKCQGGYGQEKVVGEYVVKAKRGVIMTTGGMDHNEKLKSMFHKSYPSGFYGWRYNTGDGVAMCQKVGADIWHMDVMCGGANACFMDVDPYYNFQMKVSPRQQNKMWVDRFGRRFMAEDERVPAHSGYIMLQRWEEPACKFSVPPLWVIVDTVAFNGGAWGERPGNAMERGLMVIKPDLGGWPEGWSENNQREVDKGWIRKGDTIEELAAAMRKSEWGSDIDTKNLKTSLERYNYFCETGIDEDFGRSKKTLLPLTAPPYYAFPRTVGGITAYGGARRGANGAVLDPDKKPIPRLFSAGSFGSVYGKTYSVTGGNLGELSAFGRISGRSAAAMKPWC
jgi:predicted oxidoreductase